MQTRQTERVWVPLTESAGGGIVAVMGTLLSLGLRLPDSHCSLPSVSSRW